MFCRHPRTEIRLNNSQVLFHPCEEGALDYRSGKKKVAAAATI
jgi:hypothetical protein